MAPHSSTLAWKIPWTEEPGGLQSMASKEADTTERLNNSTDSPLGLSSRSSTDQTAYRTHIYFSTFSRLGAKTVLPAELVAGEASLPGLQMAVFSLRLHVALCCVHVHSWYLFL